MDRLLVIVIPAAIMVYVFVYVLIPLFARIVVQLGAI